MAWTYIKYESGKSANVPERELESFTKMMKDKGEIEISRKQVEELNKRAKK